MKIQFDADADFKPQTGGKLTKKERTEYLVLCNQLTSRDPNISYNQITLNLLDYLKNDALDKISNLDITEDIKAKMVADLGTIFRGIDPGDTNYIGKINIVSLQIIILFTVNTIPIGTVFSDNLNDPYACYQLLTETINWKDYMEVQEFFTSQDFFTSDNIACNLFSVIYFDSKREPYTTSASPEELIYVITILDYLTLDEIITSYLNNVIICGIASTFLYADGRYLTPFEFLEHDITHGQNYNVCHSIEKASTDKILSFYNFCKETNSDKSVLYSIKFMIFLLIHESWWDFFPNNVNKNIDMSEFLSSISQNEYNAVISMDRFLNPNDLGLSIPKIYRESRDTIMNFLKLSVSNYQKALTEWGAHSPKNKSGRSAGGKKTKTKTKTKKKQSRKANYKRRKHTKKNTINISRKLPK